jgi:putative ABC transport system permease protein
MLRNLKFTLRNFKTQKLFTLVNLFGLTIGIVAASLILIYISYELSFDRFNKNSNRIFRVYSTYTREGVNAEYVQTPTPLASFLQNKFPEIAKTVRIAQITKGLVTSGDKIFFEDKIIMADSSIFNVFTFPIIIGNPNEVLAHPNSAVLSESIAKKYFGKSDPIGKTIRYNRAIDLTVTGIMKNIPGCTHLPFDIVVSMSSAKTFFGSDFLENKMNTVVFTYLLVNPNIDIERLGQSLSQTTKEANGGDFGDNELYHIQPLTSIHLYSNMGGEYTANSDVKSTYILSTIALLILIIACINYINLSFSVNSRRSIELGMRKIVGVGRRQLILLYISDSFVLVGISVIISFLIMRDLLKWFSGFVGADLITNISAGNLISEIACLFLLITLITGLTSGWISSRKSPMDTLKKPLLRGKKYIGAQGILVLFQFGISIALITSTLFVNRQMRFIKNKNLGFSKEQLMIIPLNDKKIKSKIESFKQELFANPNILSAGSVSDLPGDMKLVTSIFYDGGSGQSFSTIPFLEVDKDFVKTFGVQLKEGYPLGDIACPYIGTQYLLNESAAKKLGWDAPIGKRFSCYYGKEGFVTGIIKDFHFKSLHEVIEPLFLYTRVDNYNYLAVKLNATGITGSVNYVKQLWNKIVPDSPFEYFFYDNFYDQLYKKEALFGNIIFIFSTIAILIACMGLFGLAAFFSEKRTKEIGIRKVNGASIIEIMTMLNRDFVKWVFIAFIIATPIAWYAMNKWLQTFAYKTELIWWIFGLAGIIALVIALLTVSWQSWWAATRNPVEALRYE